MKYSFLFSIVCSFLSPTTPQAFAQHVVDAPAFLEKQSVETCFIKKVMKKFEDEQYKYQPNPNERISPVSFNSNGEKDVSSIAEPARYDGQTVLSKQRGYNVRIRQFGSGLSGSQLDFVFNSETCTPNKIYQTCGNNIYVPVKLVGGKCPTEAQSSAWNRNKKKPAPQNCPITEELCKYLEGNN